MFPWPLTLAVDLTLPRPWLLLVTAHTPLPRKAALTPVSKAYIADASPAAVCTHTSQRSQYSAIIEQYLNGVTGNYSWYPWQGVDLLFGGGAENFLPSASNGNVSQFDRWAEHDYQVGYTNTELEAFDNAQRALGIFTQGNISTWLDQHVFTDTLDFAVQPLGQQGA